MANTPFRAGDLVVSVYGDGDGSGNYTDNQASPITLEDISTSGTVIGSLVLPQTVPTGSANNAISGEYGSSSEGSLQLSADGRSLTIAGYGVNAQTFNTAPTSTYGTAALAQSTSVKGGTYTAVSRVFADIRGDGTVDTSTAVFNVYNTNNPRSVVTTDGSSFYTSGQGVKGDTTQGVFLVQDGSSTATAINTADDTRTVELYNNNLYVSQDSKQPSNGGTSNISQFSGKPTATATEAPLVGISQNQTLNGSNGNSINNSTGKINLSPENFFFANTTTLYVADGGAPKQGGVGDGGLQKYSFSNGVWNLDYTLSSGLNLVNSTTATSGTTGLIGLTGSVSGNNVSLYATNSTVGDTDQTYLYGITDQLSATAAPAGEAFNVLMTSAPDTNIRGVAFAPSAVACYLAGTLIMTVDGEKPVETLSIGDYIVTASGATRPVRWIGHREYSGRFARINRDLLPVRFAAGSLGDDLPKRDLYVSPKHAMFCDGMLVPAELLVNGASIHRLEHIDTISYWHVELESHDVLLAEGAPSESFVDDDSRAMFHNAAEFAVLYGTGEEPAHFCAPRVEAGAALEQLRRRLARHASPIEPMRRVG